MSGKKSEQGIVVNKLAGKVTKASDSMRSYGDNLFPKRKGIDVKPVCPWKKSYSI
ncbi:hypothetical protein [Oceanobacillus kapialis]|uniref:hypothetical protein n=1 Tax=Oceanobacillus kapialis TaxID=481353 RepID=UPI0038512F50